MTKITIEKGWTAFYSTELKKVFGITEFKNGGSATTALSVMTKQTKDELIAGLSELGLTYTPPPAK